MNKALLLGVLGLAVLAGTTLNASASDVSIFVGYADNIRPSPFFPNPWAGSPNTIFLGNPDPNTTFDSGAILIENSGVNDIVLAPGAFVDGFTNNRVFQLWDSLIGAGVTIHPGWGVVLTQTGYDDTEFDSSDQGSGDPSHPDASKPVVHLTLNGDMKTFVDSGQVLNTGGFDLANLNNSNESLQWRLIGTTGIDNPGGNPPGVPEPGAVAVSAAGVLGMAGFAIRRRARK